ncbi:GDSL-type esterase/lipase family protein [Mucilaginibacter sp. SP1R1]|uniref:GDSL-type esterase/lipase family protein n=1 Tax=Mucilaginibacter sp. SP1R1 TaxID=2723091 RepID=UPI001616A4EA|nr:GDSL-type esterase/lipase family protein [Mucilaginibacter sp. SP1R1]MBB6152234.1 sialate O-acetylesterase [Mucilaginibacter sp. SP1R1]
MRSKNGYLWVSTLIIFLFLNGPDFAQSQGIKVACVGNSVTYGYGLTNPAQDSYPAQLQVLLGDKYRVENFGHSGATLLKEGHNPYYKTQEFVRVLAYKPDIAIIHLGLNDTDPRDWPDHRQDFEADYTWLIESVRKSNPNVKIFICRLTPIFSGHPRFKSGTRDWYWQIQGLIPTIAKANKTGLIDLHEPLYNRPDLFADNLHPDKEGASILAQTVYQRITGDFGGLKLPDVFTDNMVLQRDRAVLVYGRANAGDVVKVQFKSESIQSKTDRCGRWNVVFAASKAGGPFQIKVTTKDSAIVIKNVLIGDVWLCAGQSNMYFPLNRSAGGSKAIVSAAENKNLHLYKLNLQAETDPVVWDSVSLAKANRLTFFSGSWKQSNAQSAADFSAVAYYFGRQITKDEGVPIGLIEVAVGGSPTESWIDRYTMEHDDKLVDMLANWQKSDFEMQFCRDRAAINLKNATHVKQRHTYEPCYNYEAAVEPLTHFPVKGVVWYQGESNTHNVELYEHLFKTLVSSWRQKWGYELPFYYVQLSSIDRPPWPAFRDAQRKLQKQIPNTAMAVSFDLGDSLNVHPTRKKEIGNRLALLAERYTYKKQIKADGPAPTVAKQEGNQIVIRFSFAVQLKTKDHEPLIGFELINDKGQHLVCTGKLKKNQVLLTAPQGEKIKAIYYATQPFTRANLINEAGLPASTFTMQLHEKESLFY